jgi:uncharacterized protein YdbL (DUF1318 family)
MSSHVHAVRLVAVLVAVLVIPDALAREDTADDLKRRLAQRDPELKRLKKAGKVGETWEGYIEAVEPVYLDEKPVKRLVNEENADREAVYALIAERTNAEQANAAKQKVTTRAVARRSATRKFEIAGPTDYLKVAGATWIQKRDEPRYRKLQDLKKQGKVGETAQGLLMPVTEEAAGDRQVRKLVDQENAARRTRFAQLAKVLKRSADQVAREKAKGYFQDARANDHVQTADGKWHRRKDLPGTGT